MSRCLVIGCGFIGSHAARALADRGHDVAVFSRGFNPWFDESQRAGIDVRQGDVEIDSRVLADLVAGADEVVYLASSSKPPTAAANPLLDVEQTIKPALAVFQHLASHPDKRLFIASSGGTVYGNPETVPTPERHPLRPATPYAISLAALEHYAEFYARTFGFRAVRLRFSNVFGPGESGRAGQGVVGTWLLHVARDEPVEISTDLELKRDFLFVGDAVCALADLVDGSPRRDVYNVGGGVSISLGEVLQAVRVVTGRDPEVVVRQQGVHPTCHIPMTLLDTSRIVSDTSWTPEVPFVEGVRRTWEWIRRQKTSRYGTRLSPSSSR
jgi:UDP-glucose 4-epimerase